MIIATRGGIGSAPLFRYHSVKRRTGDPEADPLLSPCLSRLYHGLLGVLQTSECKSSRQRR